MAGLRDGVVKRGRTWSYVIRVPDPATGMSKPKWVGGFRSEKAAKEARDEARRAARRGEYVDRTGITVSAYLAEWLDAHSLEVKPRTLAGYRYLVRQYVDPRIGTLRLQSVRPSTLSTLYRELLAGGGRNGGPLSRRTVDYVHAVLRKAFNDAVHAEQLLPSNPAERAKRPRRESRGPTQVWSADELRTFLGLMHEHRLYAFYRLAAYSGARRGELLNLRWSDVDWRRRLVHIRGSVGIVEGQRVEGTTKSGYERSVSLDPGTLDALKEHRRRQMDEMRVAGDSWTDTGHMFTTGFGQPVYPDTVSQLMAKTIKAYNDDPDRDPADRLRPARLHDLRHVHATLLLLAGVAVHVVAERLGHADPSITLRVYAHVIRTHAEGIADVFASTVDEPDDGDGATGTPAVPC